MSVTTLGYHTIPYHTTQQTAFFLSSKESCKGVSLAKHICEEEGVTQHKASSRRDSHYTTLFLAKHSFLGTGRALGVGLYSGSMQLNAFGLLLDNPLCNALIPLSFSQPICFNHSNSHGIA
jgi:hypothetical protein